MPILEITSNISNAKRTFFCKTHSRNKWHCFVSKKNIPNFCHHLTLIHILPWNCGLQRNYMFLYKGLLQNILFSKSLFNNKSEAKNSNVRYGYNITLKADCHRWNNYYKAMKKPCLPFLILQRLRTLSVLTLMSFSDVDQWKISYQNFTKVFKSQFFVINRDILQ